MVLETQVIIEQLTGIGFTHLSSPLVYFSSDEHAYIKHCFHYDEPLPQGEFASLFYLIEGKLNLKNPQVFSSHVGYNGTSFYFFPLRILDELLGRAEIAVYPKNFPYQKVTIFDPVHHLDNLDFLELKEKDFKTPFLAKLIGAKKFKDIYI